MRSAEEILSKKFSKALGGGYRPEEVDEFLDEIYTYISDVQKEKQTLSDKLEILAEKINEYREDEESLRSALLSAQKLGDKIVRDSKRQAEEIIREANINAEKVFSEAKVQAERDSRELVRIQKEASAFRSQLLSAYRTHIEMITKIPTYHDDIVQPDIRPEPEPATENENSEDIGLNNAPSENPQHEYEENNAAESKEETKEIPKIVFDSNFDDEEEESSRFGSLRFGDGFELNRPGNSKRKK